MWKQPAKDISRIITVGGFSYLCYQLHNVGIHSGLYRLTSAVVYAMLFSGLRYCLTKYIFVDIGHKFMKEASPKQYTIDKFAACLFKTMFFIFMVMYEYYVLSKESYLPGALLGWGNASELWTYGYIPSGSLLNLYMVSLGYHLHSTIYHSFFVMRRNDYYELVLHHVLTLWLIILSYFEGYIRVGSIIMFMNDIPDIFVYSSKMLSETLFVKASIVSYVGLLLSYLYFRLIVFPMVIIPTIYTGIYDNPLSTKVAYMGMLLVLYLLQLYWFTLILNIGLNVITTGSRKDIHNSHASDVD